MSQTANQRLALMSLDQRLREHEGDDQVYPRQSSEDSVVLALVCFGLMFLVGVIGLVLWALGVAV